jgi:hypothetical protein
MTWHHNPGEVILTLTLILVLIFIEISYNEDISYIIKLPHIWRKFESCHRFWLSWVVKRIQK